MLQRLCDACEAASQCITRTLLQTAARSVNILASLSCAVPVSRPVPERASVKHLKSVLSADQGSAYYNHTQQKTSFTGFQVKLPPSQTIII